MSIKRIILSCLLVMHTIPAIASNQEEDSANAVEIAPLARYEYLNLTNQQIDSTGAGLLIKGEDVKLVGLYTQYKFRETLQYLFPDRYHAIDLLLDGNKGRHHYVGIFKSESDRPVSGGINTYQSAAVYGYDLLDRPDLDFVLGGGLAIGNFGIETSDGDNWPLIPVPLVRVNYRTKWFDTTFECITSPNLSFSFAPPGNFSLTGDLRMDEIRDSRDLVYEIELRYQPYAKGEKRGVFNSVSIGFKNDNYGAFQLGDDGDDESLEVHYKAIYATLDVTVVELSAGYAFDGRALYREEVKEDLGDGYFVAVQVVYGF